MQIRRLTKQMPHYAAVFSWLKRTGSRRQGFTIFNLPLRAAPSATSSRGHLFCWFAGLAAHDLAVIRCFGQKSTFHHPLDFLVEFVGLIGLYADQFRHQPGSALRWFEIAQHLFAGTVLVLPQPVDGAVERAA